MRDITMKVSKNVKQHYIDSVNIDTLYEERNYICLYLK